MWYITLGLLTTIYLVLNFIIPSAGMFEAYILRPSLWIALAITTLIIAKNEGLNILKFTKTKRWYLGKSPIHAGILIGGFQISMLIIVGIFAGFGNSPYAFTPITITLNLIFVISLLMGTEISRAYLIKKGANFRKYSTLALTLITLLYMFVLLSPHEFTVLNFNNPALALEFIGKTLITALAINLLASYLSYLGGATASIGYMGTLLIFEWFSPILPDPHWTILALVGTIAPAIGYIIIQNSIQPFIEKNKIKKTRRTRKKRKKVNEHNWTVIAIFSVIIIFFSFGYLGVEPSVIYSGSMKPALEVGDIVVIQEVEINTIKTGDIIQFMRSDNVPLIHRVIDKYEEEGQTLFITQGDANEDPDFDPITSNQIMGKAIFTIPKIGWIQIFVKNIFKNIGLTA